jgi:serine/threonine protein kinase
MCIQILRLQAHRFNGYFTSAKNALSRSFRHLRMCSFCEMIDGEITQSVSLRIPAQFGNYTAHRIMANGTTSVVVEATERSSGQIVGAKVLSMADLARQGLLSKLEHELRILALLKHQAIVRLHEVFQ